MRFITKSLICAAQEQALATSHIRKHIWKTGKSDTCQLCREKPVTVHHIVSECKMLCGTQYLYLHNQVAKYIRWQILKILNVEVPESWLKNEPSEATMKDGIKVLWDSYILTHIKVPHNRPDINCTQYKPTIMYDHYCSNTCMYECYQKKAEKITKYRDHKIEIQKCWNLKKVRTISVAVYKGVTKYLKAISNNFIFNVIQRTALLVTAHILCNFLTPFKNLPNNSA